MIMRMEMAALALPDVTMCRGTYPVPVVRPYVSGQEGVGIVEDAVPSRRHLLGKRVVACTIQPWGSLAPVAVGVSMIFEVPEGMSSEQAAGYLIASHTAHHAAIRRGGVSSGGDSGRLGSRWRPGIGDRAVVRRAGGPGDRRGGRQRRKLPSAASWERRRWTTPKATTSPPSDNSSLGVEWTSSWIPCRGRWERCPTACSSRVVGRVVCGHTGGLIPHDPDFYLDNHSLVGVDLGGYPRETMRQFHLETQEVLTRLMAEGRYRPTVERRVAFDEVPAALEDLAARRTIGRVVVDIPQQGGMLMVTTSGTPTGTPSIRAWQVVRYGRPTEALELATIAPPQPGPGEILVRYLGLGVQLQRGRRLSRPVPHHQPATAVHPGHGVRRRGHRRRRGSRVLGRPPGDGHGDRCHRRRMRSSSSGRWTWPSTCPPELSDVEAAAFFYPFHLAHLGLHERGQLQPGETVLVHAAAGGVGSAAVQLAVAAGARVIATAGGPEKLDFARGLGADVAIDYRQGGFAAAVLEATDGRGVDVCFDGVGGEVTTESLRCLARNGRHLVIGFAGGIEAEEVPMVNGRTLCFGNFSLVGVILAYSDPALVPARFGLQPDAPHRSAMRCRPIWSTCCERGRIRPVVGKVVASTQLPEALEEMEDRTTMGRIVVRITA